MPLSHAPRSPLWPPLLQLLDELQVLNNRSEDLDVSLIDKKIDQVREQGRGPGQSCRGRRDKQREQQRQQQRCGPSMPPPSVWPLPCLTASPCRPGACACACSDDA